jgi:hypothetical protein
LLPTASISDSSLRARWRIRWCHFSRNSWYGPRRRVRSGGCPRARIHNRRFKGALRNLAAALPRVCINQELGGRNSVPGKRTVAPSTGANSVWSGLLANRCAERATVMRLSSGVASMIGDTNDLRRQRGFFPAGPKARLAVAYVEAKNPGVDVAAGHSSDYGKNRDLSFGSRNLRPGREMDFVGFASLSGDQSLGQVNGALGDTLGNLLERQEDGNRCHWHRTHRRIVSSSSRKRARTGPRTADTECRLESLCHAGFSGHVGLGHPRQV